MKTPPAHSLGPLGLLIVCVLPFTVRAADQHRAYSVREIGPHSRIWERVVPSTNRAGVVILKTNTYTEIRSGLGVRDSSGRWRESSPDFQILRNGYAVATNCQHKLMVAPTLDDPEGFLDVEMPDGSGRLRATVLGLNLFDPVSGRSVQVGSVRSGCVGQQTAPNEITFTDAFTGGLRASVRIRNDSGGYHQDVLLLDRPTAPQLQRLGFDDTSISKLRLEVWTEFLSGPAPTVRAVQVATESVPGRTMVEPDLIDESVEFPRMRMQRGTGFVEGEARQHRSAPVFKQWIQSQGRSCLIEGARYSDLLPLMQDLPESSLTAANTKVRSSRLQAGRVPLDRAKPQSTARANAPARITGLAQARLTRSPHVVLDYSLINGTLTNLTCYPDETIFVSGSATIVGTLTLMGSSVLKFTNDPSASLIVSNVQCLTGPYKIAVLTSQHDNSAGATINGSTGSPTNSNGGTYLQFSGWQNTNVWKYLRFAYAGTAICSPPMQNGVYHCQFISCGTGFEYSDTGTTCLRNVLFSGCQTAVLGWNQPISGEHLTVDGGAFNTCASDTVLLTNSILTGASAAGNQSLVNCVSNASTAGVFQAAIGAGRFYLINDSTNRAAGTTNIDSALLAELKLKTTHPPVVYCLTNVSTATLSPQAQRMGSHPDIGWAYDPIDFALSAFCVTNATLTITPGTVIATFATNDWTYGIGLAAGARVVCEGTPLNHNRIVGFNTVQEQSVSIWKTPTYASVTDWFGYEALGSRYRFTDWHSLAQDIPHLSTCGSDPSSLRDCQFYAGTLMIWSPVQITNSLFEYVNADIEPFVEAPTVIRNSLFVGGTFGIVPFAGVPIIKDNLFDRTLIPDWMGGAMVYDGGFNAFVTNCDRLVPTNSADIILPATPAYESGPLGNYYLPALTNSPLLDAGSVTNAALVGLYHFTTIKNQTKEGSSRLDISLHYVAVDDNGNPTDSESDGIWDVTEDTSGNGDTEPGETDWTNPDTDSDALDDLSEIGIHNTDPFDPDSDSDGRLDGQEISDGTDPLDPLNFIAARLALWPFDESTLVGDHGQFPLEATNVQITASWSTNALIIQSPFPAYLKYHVVETNGSPNLKLEHGSFQFWFKPHWASTNAGGTGPQHWVNLFGVGDWTPNGSSGYWGLRFNPAGNLLQFETQADGLAVTNLSIETSWTSNVWHHLTVSYSASNSQFYLDGQQLATNGPGISRIPSSGAQAGGLSIGSSRAGDAQANGQFEELATFDGPLTSTEVLAEFLEQIHRDTDHDGLSDFEEFGHGTSPHSADTDYDGRTDAQEFTDGTDPLDPDDTFITKLGSWRFNTPEMLGEQGQAPLASLNHTNPLSWSGTCVEIDRANAVFLRYAEAEADGSANINCRAGAVRFWFKPNWSSHGLLGGSGPGCEGRLLELGASADTNGWWALLLNTNGTQISFLTASNALAITNLAAGITWDSNTWHQLVLTFCATNSALYIDGQPLTQNGLGVSGIPAVPARVGGFGLGSDLSGMQQAHGQFEELETFNFVLDPSSISDGYTLAQPLLGAPQIFLLTTNDGLLCTISMQAPYGDQIVSAVTTNFYGVDTLMDVETDFADSFFAQGADHLQSLSVGVNVTKLPPPLLSPQGGDFNSPTNLLIAFGVENLTNMVDGIVRTELARATTDVSELLDWTGYALDLRSLGFSDEDIRANLINNFRITWEYINTHGSPGALYVANTNYTIEYTTNAGQSWTVYTAPLVVTQTMTIEARARKTSTSDTRTHYSHLTSTSSTALLTIIPSGWFVTHFGTNYQSNTNATARADPDGDGLLNWEELQSATSPTNPDTDGDGRTDSQELLDGTDPLNAGQVFLTRLSHWTFNDTNTWCGGAGQLPLLFTNAEGVLSWDVSALRIANANSNAFIRYRIVEPNGAANLSCRLGTLSFWFNADWSSSNATYNGFGPATDARFLEIGSHSTELTNGWWSLFLNPAGTQIAFVTQTNGSVTTNLLSTISWNSNEWHQLVLTYSSNNSSIYIDGQPANTNGSGVLCWPNPNELALGFTVGSDQQGNRQSCGKFEELEFFNYQVSAADIFTHFQQLITRDSDGNGMPDMDQDSDGLGKVLCNDFDGDGLSNTEEQKNGTDAFDPDSDHDGISDGHEVLIYGTNPLAPNQAVPTSIVIQRCPL